MKKSPKNVQDRHRRRHHPRHHRLAGLLPATAPARATTSPSPNWAAWATRPTTATCASRDSCKPGSIEQNGTHVTFVLNEFESHSPKAATRPPAEGELQGHRAAARHIQGRCAGPGRGHLSAATASSTPTRCRPSAPASTRPPARPARRSARQPAPATKTAANAAPGADQAAAVR